MNILMYLDNDFQRGVEEYVPIFLNTDDEYFQFVEKQVCRVNDNLLYLSRAACTVQHSCDIMCGDSTSTVKTLSVQSDAFTEHGSYEKYFVSKNCQFSCQRNRFYKKMGQKSDVCHVQCAWLLNHEPWELSIGRLSYQQLCKQLKHIGRQSAAACSYNSKSVVALFYGFIWLKLALEAVSCKQCVMDWDIAPLL